MLLAFGPDYWVCDFAWSPDEKTLAVASEWISAGSGINTTNIRVYRVGETVTYGNDIITSMESLPLSGRCRSAIAWSHDSQVVAIGSSDGIRFYESSEFDELGYVQQKNVLALSWHPSGKFIAIGTKSGELQVYGIPISE